ncbi:MAG: hypothetical protein NTY77_05555 [Elusimicrobia bacterium]|nr:hypothetical protein [Elusimicrobiota bacterium]
MSRRCEAWCPPSTYTQLRPCSKHTNLRRVGRLLLCPHHRAMAEAGRRVRTRGS